jgi:hypothetical protein
MADSPYKIAVGHNNVGGLVPVNTIVDANGIKFPPPRGVASEGQKQKGPNGVDRYRGYPSVTWFLPLLNAQITKVRDTYVGPVTITTSLDGGDTFADYNAISSIDDRAQLDGQRVNIGLLVGDDVGADFAGIGYNSTPWRLTRLEAI